MSLSKVTNWNDSKVVQADSATTVFNERLSTMLRKYYIQGQEWWDNDGELMEAKPWLERVSQTAWEGFQMGFNAAEDICIRRMDPSVRGVIDAYKVPEELL